MRHENYIIQTVTIVEGILPLYLDINSFRVLYYWATLTKGALALGRVTRRVLVTVSVTVATPVAEAQTRTAEQKVMVSPGKVMAPVAELDTEAELVMSELLDAVAVPL